MIVWELSNTILKLVILFITKIIGFTFDILVVLSQILYIYGDIVNLDILIIIKIL